MCADCGGELIRLGQDCPVCRARSPNVVYRHRFDADPDPYPNFHVDADPDPILSLTIFRKSRRKKFTLIHSSASFIFLVSVIGVKTSIF